MSRKGFTLIELLIVVAIIAILAAIAVPNFLEAQIRSKVSRVKADLRTIATALEIYNVDQSSYPIPFTTTTQYRASTTPPVNSCNSYLPDTVTTPIAYITSRDLRDPFAVNVYDNTHDRLFYQNIKWWSDPTISHANPVDIGTITESLWIPRYGFWKVGSLGPDKDYSGGIDPSTGAIQDYDATNGTVSGGDIYRSQKRPEGGFTEGL